ncbi:metallophosphoesterase [Oenococcus alcoholitolerans]|uniref:metallophosphoesterase n=1 Tax=Oenococcus alcoholitolerans TaxID=931074 RepID=UPI003F717DF9
MKFVTADTHFFDPAMIEHPHFAPRRADFLTVGDMDQAIIDAWNHTVTDQDVVYHCGDIAVYYKTASPKQLLDLLDHLKVQIIFVKGNHDSRDLFKYLEKNNHPVSADNPNKKFSFHDVGAYFKYDHHQFFLTHYPLIFGITQNSINLHGHIHHSSVDIKENINVGIDSADFDYFPHDHMPIFGAPLSMQQIDFLIKAKADDFAKRR